MSVALSTSPIPSGPGYVRQPPMINAFLAVIACGFVFGIAIGYIHAVNEPRPVPVTPAPVKVEPAKCSSACDCKAKPVPPFNVVCPYCRNVIQVRPPATTGSTGAVVTRSK